MSTSLNVVSIAICCFASTRCLATVRRNIVIGTIFSPGARLRFEPDLRLRQNFFFGFLNFYFFVRRFFRFNNVGSFASPFFCAGFGDFQVDFLFSFRQPEPLFQFLFLNPKRVSCFESTFGFSISAFCFRRLPFLSRRSFQFAPRLRRISRCRRLGAKFSTSPSGAGSFQSRLLRIQHRDVFIFLTMSPSDFSHSAICTSLMDSPTLGIFNSIVINFILPAIWTTLPFSAMARMLLHFRNRQMRGGSVLPVPIYARRTNRSPDSRIRDGSRMQTASGQKDVCQIFHAKTATRPCCAALPEPKSPAFI